MSDALRRWGAMKPINVGLLGFGTVGKGTWDVLRRNQEEIQRRAGRPIAINWIATRTLDRAREGTRGVAGVNLTNDPAVVVRHPDVDIVCELIGGIDPARSLVLDAIAHGKHVVTANKALLAHHGTEIFAAAHAKGVMVGFEASVAGGIPIIKALREGLTANSIEWIAGIINGTSNFILSEMRARGASFADVLAEAQARGFAEADPTFDVEGIDAAHKLTIMSAIAFGVPMQFDKAYAEGITKLTQEDIRYAEELGYRIKLLGITRRTAARDRAARASDAGAREATDRQRRRCDECGAGEGRRRRRDALLRARRGRRADRERRDRRPGRRDAHAHGRSRASRPASRLPARPAVEPSVPADGRRARPATTCGCASTTSPACWPTSRASSPIASISIDAMIQKEPPEGEKQTDIILLTHLSREAQVVDAIARDRGAADGARKHRADPPRRAAGMNYVSTRGRMTAAADALPFRAILLEGLAADGGLAVPRALSAVHAGRDRAPARSRLPRTRVRGAVEVRRRHSARPISSA